MPGDTDERDVARELKDFEGNLSRLEEVVATLEKGGTPLHTSLQLFEEGMTLLKRLQGVLDTAESRIDELIRDAEGTLATRPFDVPQ